MEYSEFIGGYLMTAIDVRDLPARIDEAIALASSGTEIMIVDGSVPRARLVAVTAPPPRKAGLHLGAIQTTEDFDAPLPEGFWIPAT